MSELVRLVDVPELRVPKPAVLRACRAIDPAAEIVYLGEGEWWLGAVRPNRFRRATATRIWEAEHARDAGPRAEELRLASLMGQGFASIQRFSVEGELTDQITNWFRDADWWYRHTPVATQEEQLIDAPERAVRRNAREWHRDRLHTDGRWAFRRARGKAPTYSIPSTEVGVSRALPVHPGDGT